MFDFFKVQKVIPEVKKIKEAEDFENIDNISKYFKDKTGIDFENQKTILKSKVSTLCRINNISTFHKCMEELNSNSEFRQEAINYLTTNESFFYREFDQIASLVEKVKDNYRHVDILCAPSATGEEPYSITIALFEAGVTNEKFSVTGIDISSNAIKISQEGQYNDKSVRNLSQSIREKWFTKEQDIYHVNQEVKNQVSFRCVNIFEKEFEKLGKFDYIFSRNMLIYFDHDTRQKACSIFEEHLKNRDEEIFYGHADLPHGSH